jgi:hypothetical protein
VVWRLVDCDCRQTTHEISISISRSVSLNYR